MRRIPPIKFAEPADPFRYTAKDLHEVVDLLHPNNPRRPAEWAVFREVRFGTGASASADSAIDAFAFNCWPSGGFKRVSYEIKVSRGDFLRELKNPLKRRPALAVSNEFYFLVCPGVVHNVEEIPVGCGLILAAKYVQAGRVRWNVQKQVPALPRDEEGASWAFLASLARRIATHEAKA